MADDTELQSLFRSFFAPKVEVENDKPHHDTFIKQEAERPILNGSVVSLRSALANKYPRVLEDLRKTAKSYLPKAAP